ncbi:hypothetical protein TREMEDRAFT_70610 [Tremella mesenterica DSM 1558]|uniref:uncharacterized protein n=1 Tax=Tremella mesenterica (strain ATCC 24925 / CBS 8224 / DSM 1558 / NBRC 9311 / NRRL Y-6157 / RJB 2259-6 / UBC 559-6) TaxID=578456 RepID=UPI0003F495F7|nr:uncharacterized protein TREMEDRAFT_70610 [Tremella mesenterica DSM 1558]EIW72022.1 hypothetical protein TREMEDRAFT_70610 [Tremella mesenterica DSM 1558]
MSMNLGAAKRGKPKIRPPKKPDPQTSIKETWIKLANAIREIQNHNASKLSFEEHYRYAYNMVLFKNGDQLYAGVKGLISEHLEKLAEDKIVPTFPRSSGTSGTGKRRSGAEAVESAMEGDRFLKAVKTVWEDHTGSMRKLKDVLKYMDKVYTPAAGVPQIYDVGLTLFLQHIVRSLRHSIHTHLIATLLSQIQLERDGEIITRSTVRDCIDILLRLTLSEREGGKSVYSTDFEPEFLRNSADYYRAEALEIIERGDASRYLQNVERRLSEETDRTAHYLSSLTHSQLHSLLVEHLLTPHLSTILSMPGSGLVSMIEHDRVSDLRRLYTLFLHVPKDAGRIALRLALRADAEDRGRTINENSALSESGSAGPAEEQTMDVDPDDVKGKGKAKSQVVSGGNALLAALKWVQDSVDLKDRFDRLLDEAFGGDKSLQMSINEAFQSFINANPRSPEYLSLYIDEHLKKGTKTKSEDEIEAALDKTTTLFRFLQDKDKFERYYKIHLARRLLYGRSVSDDAEKGMVAKLKVEMGFQFTQKLEGMFTDMRLSTDSAHLFQQFTQRHQIPFSLSVNVLTASYWPPTIVSASTCTFGPLLSSGQDTFEKYYAGRHSGRRLVWQGGLGTADVRVRFKARSHDLNVSTQALVVLLLFENVPTDESLAYTEIQSSTNLPDADLRRTLQSLACGKFRVLTKTPKGREVDSTDVFSFNEGFTSNLARIKIMQVANKVESNKEREETQEQVAEERKHQIEACIVRIMKNRKMMSHNDLVSEVAHQLSSRFNPPLNLVKKRIEGLIDREYLERTGDMATYKYLA